MMNKENKHETENKYEQATTSKKLNSHEVYTPLIIAGLCISLLIVGVIYRYNENPQIKDFEEKKIEIDEKQMSDQIAALNFKNDAEQITEAKKLEEIEKYKAPYKEPPPEISAKAYVVENQKKDIRMYASDADKSLAPASLTKIMTALVAIENYKLDKTAVIPPECTTIEGSKVGFAAYDVFTIEDLLYGLLVKSGADAACAIASIDGHDKFLENMNERAQELDMQNTTFENEIGFDSANAQKSSVNDIILMSKEALKHKTFQKIVGTENKNITALNSGRVYSITNTNDLLGLPGSVGIKTGYTEDAGQCLAYLYENKDEEILIVVLGSEDRFADTETLLEWAREQTKLMQEEENHFGG